MSDVNSRFDLNPEIYRTPEQRIDMILDPECPREVLETVATFDEDQDVLLSVLRSPVIDDDIVDIVKDRLGDVYNDLLESKLLREADQSSFCTIPWIHAGTNANGSIRACCQMIYTDESSNVGLIEKDDGTLLNYNDKISKNRNAKFWKMLRSDMLQGKRPSACKLCFDEEDAVPHGMSRRKYANKHFPDVVLNAYEKTKKDGKIKNKDFPIRWWDLRFGNKCNLKCRSCGPSNSDLWYKDYMEMADSKKSDKPFTIDLDGERAEIITNSKGQVEIPHMKSWYEGSQLWTDITKNLKHIERLYFTGGEPTINHKHRELLEMIVEKGLAKNIELEYNSNMAASSKSFFDLWSQFKKVVIGMSLDGMDSHFEYIRNPGKWSKTERLLKELDTDPRLDNLEAKVTLTLSIMNVFHVPDFMYWIKEQNFKRLSNEMHIHLVFGPEQYCIQNLPTYLKKEVEDLYNRFITHIWKRWPIDTCTQHDMIWAGITETALKQALGQMWAKEQDPTKWEQFKRDTVRLDKIRKEDWKESLPDLAAAIGRMNDAEKRKQRTKLADLSKKVKTKV